MKHSTQTCGSNDSSWKGTHREKPQSMDDLAPRSRTSATLQMYYQYQREEKSHREREKKVLLVGSLVVWVAMTVAAFGQDRGNWTLLNNSYPVDPFSLHELAQRYGIDEAVHMSFQLQEEEEARREMEQVKAAQRRDRELHKKVAELADTSLKLYQRLSDPSVIHADTPELAKRCEKLAKAIKKLLR